MTGDERTRLAGLMARMAEGDDDAVFVLHHEFGSWLAAKMRSHLQALGAPRPSADDLDGLVLDACFELYRCAGAWDPEGGALPWNWARHRLRQVASDWVGQYADELDEALLRHPARHVAAAAVTTPASSVPEDDVLVVLDRLAERDGAVREFRRALVEVASERDQRIVLEVRVQAVLGDPSPANTVAAMTDLTPAAVRKVCSRVRARMRTVHGQPVESELAAVQDAA